MKISVLTLFPELISQYCAVSIMGRAQQANVMTVETVNPRAFTPGPHHKVDDAPYGGGPGMVMMCDPVVSAYRSLGPLAPNTPVLLTSPAGRPIQQKQLRQWASSSHVSQLVIICGHYEGIDARILGAIPAIEPVSLGDFVLTGGELAALAIIDGVTRLLPGALGKDHSSVEESFENGLLEYPHYTRPPVYEGLRVPDILLSGNHAAIARWRQMQSEELTARHRADLWSEHQTRV